MPKKKRFLIDTCTDLWTGGPNTRAFGRGSRGDFRGVFGGHGGMDGNVSVSSGSKITTSTLPPLPASAPYPEGTGAQVPYTEHATRGTIGRRVTVLANHHVIQYLPVIKIFQ